MILPKSFKYADLKKLLLLSQLKSAVLFNMFVESMIHFKSNESKCKNIHHACEFLLHTIVSKNY